MAGEFIDKNILVTGGAAGIGAAVVRAFHREGAQVFFCDVNRRAGAGLVRELGERVTFQRVDLTRERDVRAWIGGVGRQVGEISALINNAARDPRIALAKTSAKQWDDLFATNLRAYFLTCREAVKWMRPGAAIVNFGSVTFHLGPVDMSAYVATKGGVLGFTRSLARELGPRRIRVNTIAPGWVMTERQVREHVTPAIRKLIRANQCIPDLIQPDEIADVVLFLAGERSRTLTGQELLADRGWQHS